MNKRLLAPALLLLLTASCKAPRDNASGGDSSGTDSAAGVARQDSVAPYEHETLGALQVMSASPNPVYWFQVRRNDSAMPGNPPLLNSTVELAPGNYDVNVNRTRRPVTIEAGRKTILWTGDLVVEGGVSSAYWYAIEGTESRYTSNPPLVGTPLALFPGSYRAVVVTSVTVPSDTMGPADVVAGRRTTLRRQ